MRLRDNTWATCLLLLPAVSSARGETAIVETEEDGVPTTVYKIVAEPAEEPWPALRFRLLPSDAALKSGNAATFYYRAVLESRNLVQSLRKQHGDDLETWRSTSIESLPREEVRKAIDQFDAVVLPSLREAGIRDSCDWDLQLRGLRGLDVISLPLPEFQASREISRLLAVKAHLAIAEGDFPGAAEAMRLNYRMARDVSRPQFLVAGLIGIADGQIMNRQIAFWIGAPDSPNLYWAIAQLPRPLIDLRPAIQYEVNFAQRIFPWLESAEQEERSPEGWRHLLGRELQETIASLTSGNPLVTEMSPEWRDALFQMGGAAIGLRHYTEAKRALIASGMAEDRVEAMPVAQVLAVQASRVYRYVSDEYEKWWYVPYWQAIQGMIEVEQRLSDEGYLGGAAGGKEIFPIASLLLPAMQAARAAEARIDREVAALQTLEAIRMHAAANDGLPPAELGDVKIVPIPNNPFTGLPFVYRRDGRKAILDLPASDGGHHAVRYELTLIQNQENSR